MEKGFKVGDHVMIPEHIPGYHYIFRYKLSRISRETKHFWFVDDLSFPKLGGAFYVKPEEFSKRLSTRNYFVQFDHDLYRKQLDETEKWMKAEYLSCYDFSILGLDGICKVFDCIKTLEQNMNKG